MYLHLGQNIIVNEKNIVGVFDLDNSTVSKHTRDLLGKAQREGRVVNVSPELPKSFILCREGDASVVYLSQISPATLFKRSQSFADALSKQEKSE